MLSSFRRFSSNATQGTVQNIFKKNVIPGVGRVILTSSCKGGVGKSTVALNTAIALAHTGAKVGLFDGDIYGPSIPTMADTKDNFLASDKDANFLPVKANGIDTVSLGNAVDKEAALLWKGPIVGKVISEFLLKAAWPDLDYLVVDTPPGTGDVHLTLLQSFHIDGTLLVTTPQEISVADVRKSISLFKQMHIPILGIIQNFDGFICEHCKTQSKIFPGNGAEELSLEFNIPILGSLPIDPEISKSSDKGVPAIVEHPNSAYAKAFQNVADTIISFLPKVKPKMPAKKLE
ncbi:iron-sulfur cluster carrier protein ApbC [Histomonas meleagridis]|uniref:iron-sulfur cluster carrier protein ApbC n=1 Tax=Histomonas meleagridis TaxID=135588 RepID=UPI003559BA48|nr:iron-sulfur cluster carrier protein ApbC [Histomonas meleagridis]KAH0799760.1 iron-sulfur cluster carrier protein ApbC [Histomonas meleagridis]